MSVMTRVADKAGALGSIVSAMGCGACFPALASLGAALGLGFLSQFEAVFITVLLPLFAGLALLANALGWFSHRQWHRTVLGMIGPVIVLIASFTVAEDGTSGVLDLLTGDTDLDGDTLSIKSINGGNGFQMIRHRLGLAYTDSCLDLAFTWRRDYVTNGDAVRGNSYSLTLSFKNIGTR